MEKLIKTLYKIAQSIPETLFDINAPVPGTSLYIYPVTGQYVFGPEGKGTLFSDLEPAEQLEFPLVMEAHPVNKDFLLMYLKIVMSEQSERATLAIALEGMYEAHDKS
jgi:hypothetical protein